MMHPELRAAAAEYIRAVKAHGDYWREQWPRPGNDRETFLARLDAMCALSSALVRHVPFVAERERTFRHIARVARQHNFHPPCRYD